MNAAKIEKRHGALPMYHAPVTRDQWLETAQLQHDAGARLLALWGSDERDRNRDAGFLLRAAVQDSFRIVVLELALPANAPNYPTLASIFPAAERMERAVFDLLGMRAEGGDSRSWLRHASWPQDQYPLWRDFGTERNYPAAQENYSFVRVEGDGVHEIAVGPVHAGVIEPGHFRFSVVGEKVLRLEERLGYVHKGIEKRFEQLSLLEGQRLAARVSGDSAVAFSWAYCMALESLCGITPPPRALHLRALALERERIANHLGDLGALGNDAGLAFGQAQFSRLKEDLLRLNAVALGGRYPMDQVVPGGVVKDLSENMRQKLCDESGRLEQEVQTLRDIYDEHPGMQDRFVGCGQVTAELARHLGLVGLTARASGVARDVRCDLALPPYDQLSVRKAGYVEGDVAARVGIRFDEVLESLRLCRALLQELPEGATQMSLSKAPEGAFGLGLIEGWRGPVFVALEAGADGMTRRCHPHDPSWQNWPVLEHAVIGNIVPDFPLINKSFNLSYSGQDL